jgi:hypothetical protein
MRDFSPASLVHFSSRYCWSVRLDRRPSHLAPGGLRFRGREAGSSPVESVGKVPLPLPDCSASVPVLLPRVAVAPPGEVRLAETAAATIAPIASQHTGRQRIKSAARNGTAHYGAPPHSRH